MILNGDVEVDATTTTATHELMPPNLATFVSQHDRNDENRDTSSLRFIPPIPESFCFVDENFYRDTFSVDGFVKRNAKRVKSLETLKEQLTAYAKTLKRAMIDLINEDYAEFINLSTNLISFDKSINNIRTPVIKFVQETGDVQTRIEDVIAQLSAKQTRLRTIRDNKARINLMLEISAYLVRVERNMATIEAAEDSDTDADCRYSEIMRLNAISDESAALIARMQTNFDLVLNRSTHTDAHDGASSDQLLTSMKRRFDQCSNAFYRHLESNICYMLDYDLAKLAEDDGSRLASVTDLIEKLVRVYLLNGKQRELERLIATRIVKPHFDSIINDAYLSKHGTEGMFAKVLEFIDIKCALLIRVLANRRAPIIGTITHINGTIMHENTRDDEPRENNDRRLSPLGYDLLINALWTQLVDDCLVRAGALFSLANAETFYRNYVVAFRFVDDFAQKTGITNYRARFDSEPSYRRFKAKFNLNAYFYMRLQQIVPNIERAFIEFRFSKTNPSAKFGYGDEHFRLNISRIIFDHIIACWPRMSNTDANDEEDAVRNIGDLFPYLWKITLKIISRYARWIAEINLESLTQESRTTASGKPHQTVESSQDLHSLKQNLAALIFDSQLFATKFTNFYHTVIVPLWRNYFDRLKAKIDYHRSSSCRSTDNNIFPQTQRNVLLESSASLDRSFAKTIETFHSAATAHVGALMKMQILAECLPTLDFVNDIPRLYRRTNKEKPSKASNYVGKCCDDLHRSLTMISCADLDWLTQDLFTELTAHYKRATLEVLTSVQKTEESLKKLNLKKSKSQLTQSSSSLNYNVSTAAISDDDKIRLQIYYDVQHLATEMQNKLHIDLRTIKPYHELAEMVSSLKNLI